MNRSTYVWDFFIAHAGADKAIAEDVYDRLISDACVFLDCRCLELGNDWDVKLREAQQNSYVTLVLISVNTDKAYYQREEIAVAIALARSESEHRVVPIYLNEEAAEAESVPYGLRLKHGLTLSDSFGLDELCKALRQLGSRLGIGTKASAGTFHVAIDQSYQQDWWIGEPTLTAGYSSITSFSPKFTSWTVHRDGYVSTNALEGTDVLILPTPFRTYVPYTEYREIVRWVQRGGGLLLLGIYVMEVHHRNNLNQLLRRLGMEFCHNLLMPVGRESFKECMDQAFEYQDSTLWIVSGVRGSKSDHPILNNVDKIALTSSCSVECAKDPELLVTTSDDVSTLHVKGFKDPETGRIVRPTDYILDKRGPGAFLAALRYGKGRVVGIGSWKVFLNEFLENESLDNSKLLHNCITWLKSE
jgi:hypothetical protein